MRCKVIEALESPPVQDPSILIIMEFIMSPFYVFVVLQFVVCFVQYYVSGKKWIKCIMDGTTQITPFSRLSQLKLAPLNTNLNTLKNTSADFRGTEISATKVLFTIVLMKLSTVEPR